MPDRLTDNRDTDYPRAPLVGHVPVYVARPPASEYADKADLIDARIQSSSSGPGRTYPDKWVVAYAAASLPQELSTVTVSRQFGVLSAEIDEDFASVRASKKLNNSRIVQVTNRRLAGAKT